jgi:hypothetical protein
VADVTVVLVSDGTVVLVSDRTVWYRRVMSLCAIGR